MAVTCRKGYEIKVLSSCAGYYLGTVTKDGVPYCRCSTGYTATREEAEKYLHIDRYDSMENEFCNEGKGCLDYGCSKDNN